MLILGQRTVGWNASKTDMLSILSNFVTFKRPTEMHYTFLESFLYAEKLFCISKTSLSIIIGTAIRNVSPSKF